MEKDDARKLSPAEQHERRRQVIRARKRGWTRAQVAAEVGLNHTAVTKVIVRYEDEGAAVLAPRKQGRRSGEHRALTAEQEDAVRRIICDKRPRPSRPGWTSNTPRSSSAPRPWGPRFTGATRPRWSTQIYAVAVTRRPGRHLWPSGRRLSPEAVDDGHRHQPGQDTLDDH